MALGAATGPWPRRSEGHVIISVVETEAEVRSPVSIEGENPWFHHGETNSGCPTSNC